jgi:hypothetical protein
MWRRTIVVALTCLSLNSASYALDPVGPPKALLGEGHWGLGVEYAHSQTDTEIEGFFGTPVESASGQLRANEAYANLRYGVWQNVDAFARLGVVAFDEAPFSEAGAGLAWGFGAAATVYDTDKLDWGLVVQFSRGESSNHGMPPIVPGGFEIEAWSFQVAAGPTYQFREDLAVYGGLFYDMLQGEIESGALHLDIEENDPFGGFVGLDWEVKEDARLSVEFQYAGSTLAVATGLRWILE